MAMDVGGKGKLKADINVTPLVDVLLVLLIIFMVITPLSQRGYDLEIPREASTNLPPDTDIKNIMLSVSDQDCALDQPLQNNTLPTNCKVRINNEPVAVTELPKRLDEIFKVRKRADKILFFAAQEKLNYEGIIQILDIAKNAVGEDLKLAIVKDEKFALPAAAGS